MGLGFDLFDLVGLPVVARSSNKNYVVCLRPQQQKTALRRVFFWHFFHNLLGASPGMESILVTRKVKCYAERKESLAQN